METQTPLSKISVAGFSFTILAAVGAAASGLGHRLGLWHFRTGFMVLEWSVYIAVIGLVISLVAIYITSVRKSRRGLTLAGTGLLLTLVTIIPPLIWAQAARSVPRIHDISTDTENPPRFSAILPLRQNAPNPAEYGGDEIARLQQIGYPELEPLHLREPPPVVFDVALQVAHDLGWQVVSADAFEGLIEATATTFWFGFKDDVIVRVRPHGNGTLIDVRSVSRVGVSDVGTNARRIKQFLASLKDKLN